MNSHSDVPSPETLLKWATAFYELGPRRPGHPAGIAAERLCESRFRELGLQAVSRDPIPINCWTADDYSLELIGPTASEPFRCFYVPHTEFTGARGVEARAVYLGEGRRRDFASRDLRGKIAVVDLRFIKLKPALMRLPALAWHDPDNYLKSIGTEFAVWGRPNFLSAYNRALRAGAVGFVGLLNDLPAGDTYYAPYDGVDRPLPGLYLGRTESARLRTALAARSQPVLRFKLQGRRWAGETSNVYGYLPGTTDETIMVACHTDGPFGSAVEDGSGLAAVFGIAQALSQTAGKRRRNLLFVGTAGHFHGSIGARHMLRNRLQDTLAKVVCEIHLEHICKAAEPLPDGSGYRPLDEIYHRAIFTTPSLALVKALRAMIYGHDLRRMALLPAAEPLGKYPPTDGSFYLVAGIPIINYISGPPYLLSEDDRPEFVDENELYRVAGAFSDLIERLDGIPAGKLGKRRPNPRKVARFLDRLDREGTEPWFARRLAALDLLTRYL